jgi:hypothetical protein
MARRKLTLSVENTDDEFVKGYFTPLLRIKMRLGERKIVL